MVNFNLYPPLPSALSIAKWGFAIRAQGPPPEAPGPHSAEAPPQVVCHLKAVQAKRQGLINNEEKMFKVDMK